MSMRKQAIKQEVAEWDKALQTSTSQDTEKAKLQEEIIIELSASVHSAVEEVKKEKAMADEAEQPAKILNKSLELAKMIEKAYKKALDGLDKDKPVLTD